MTWVTLRQPRGPMPARSAMLRGEVLALGVVRAGGLLEVREPGPVLDVEQVLPVPREDVRAAGELVVLVRLVDGEGAAGSAERACLELAHRGMDEVGRVGSAGRRQSRRGHAGPRSTRVGRSPSAVASRAYDSSVRTLPASAS